MFLQDHHLIWQYTLFLLLGISRVLAQDQNSAQGMDTVAILTISLSSLLGVLALVSFYYLIPRFYENYRISKITNKSLKVKGNSKLTEGPSANHSNSYTPSSVAFAPQIIGSSNLYNVGHRQSISMRANPMAPIGEQPQGITSNDTSVSRASAFIHEHSIDNSVSRSITASFNPFKLQPETDFRIGDQIGFGMYASIYKGRLTIPREGFTEVAIKMINVPDATLFLYEISILKTLPPSPNVMKFFGYFENPGGYVMKLYSGTLESLITNSSIQITALDAMRLATDIAKGGLHIHTNDIVHFSIRPQSILLDFVDGIGFQAVICDFELAKPLGTEIKSSLQKLSQMLDFPPKVESQILYCAPEILEKLGTESGDTLNIKSQEIHKKCDVFSFGYCVIEILMRSRAWESEYSASTPPPPSPPSNENNNPEVTGNANEMAPSDPTPPPQNDQIHSLIQKIKNGHRPAIPAYLFEFSSVDTNISKLLNVISGCWDPNPDQRPSFQGALLDLTSKILNIS